MTEYSQRQGRWEFQDEKIEKGETSQKTPEREIREEFDMGIQVGTLLDTTEEDYPTLHLPMKCIGVRSGMVDWYCRRVMGYLQKASESDELLSS